MVSWGEKKQVALKFLAQLRNVLPQIQEPARSGPGPVSSDLAAELQKLADLKAQGLLSEDEFKAAKQRLLNA